MESHTLESEQEPQVLLKITGLDLVVILVVLALELLKQSKLSGHLTEKSSQISQSPATGNYLLLLEMVFSQKNTMPLIILCISTRESNRIVYCYYLLMLFVSRRKTFFT